MKRQISGVSFILAAVLAFSASASAGVLRIRIHAVQPASQTGGDLQVLATDGRIYDLSPSEEGLKVRLDAAVETQVPVDLHLNDAGERVLGVTDVPAEALASYSDEILDAQMAAVAQASGDPEVEKLLFPMPTDFRPTVVSSRAQAEEIFSHMFRGTSGTSQCFQRANYWAHSLYLFQGVRVMKVFVFFSEAYRSLDPNRPEDYIRLGFRPAREGAPNHKWWFHVSPMIYIQESADQEPSELVIDAGFGSVIRGPLAMRDWTNVFVDTHKECPVIDNYSVVRADQQEYRADPDRYKRRLRGREHCWLRIVPMYVYQPSDIEAADRSGVMPRSWSRWAMANMECAVRRCALF